MKVLVTKEYLTNIANSIRNKKGNTTKYKDGQNIKYAGIISSIKKKYTKSNKLMAFVSIEDLYGTAEIKDVPIASLTNII